MLSLLIGVSAAADDGPDAGSALERLRQRSAEARWQEQRQQWITPLDPIPDDRPTPADSPEEGVFPTPTITLDLSEPEQSFPIESVPALQEGVSTQATEETTSAPGSGLNPVQPGHSILADEIQPVPDSRVQRAELHQSSAGAAGLGSAFRARAILGSQLVAHRQEAGNSTSERGKLIGPVSNITPFADYHPGMDDETVEDPSNPPATVLYPDEVDVVESTAAPRGFAYYPWLASNVYHNPLYFEDPVLERYGQVHVHDALQPLYSLTRFGVQLVGLPYQMALYSCCDHVYPLGYYRPGDPAPKLIYQPPLNARAAAKSALVYTGLFFLVP